MRIEELDIVTLSDDKDYIVAKKVVLNGINYYCFVDTEDIESLKFVQEDHEELVDVNDEYTFKKMIYLMSEAIRTNELLVGLRNRLKIKEESVFN